MTNLIKYFASLLLIVLLISVSGLVVQLIRFIAEKATPKEIVPWYLVTLFITLIVIFCF